MRPAFPTGTRPARMILAALALSAAPIALSAVDVSRLPPPVAEQIDFVRDIRPIFEGACIRCHGAERPRGGFSLVTRQAALKGGDSGVAVVPGQSADSPLIHYVARLVPDMEMPPEGKGDPLRPAEIALLRAWIDQGAEWDESDAGAEYLPQFTFTPAVRWVTVKGNAQKFQEHHWIRRGTSQGLDHFRLAQKLTNGVSVLAEGRLMTDDYRVSLEVRKPEVGHAQFGFEQFRHYYDHHGPYYPFEARGFATPAQRIHELEKELHLDRGRAYAEFGLELPDWPRMEVGYEYRFQDGRKSTEQFGPVSQTTSGTNFVRRIYPAFKDIHEDMHLLTLDVAHEISGVELEDHLRVEFSRLRTTRDNAVSFPAGHAYPAAFTRTRENYDEVHLANTFQGGKAVRNWLYVSAGYLFTHSDADAALGQQTVDGAGRPAAGTFWSATDIVLKQDAHIFNVNGMGGPWDGFTAAIGVQPGFSTQEGFGNINTREGDPNDPTVGLTDHPGYVRSDLEKMSVDETVVLRYTKIPRTVLFAEARLKQERIGQYEEETGGDHEFLRDTDAANDWQEYRAGFDVSPWRQLAFNASYRFRRHDSDFDHDRDEQPIGTPGPGYSAFILSRRSVTDGAETRLVYRPQSWVKASVGYRFAATDYRTRTEAVDTPLVRTPEGTVHAGNHDSSALSANITLTPWKRFYATVTFSWTDSRITTADNDSPAVETYEGDIYSVLASATYALTEQTDLVASYNYSAARYGQQNHAGGLPLGIDYDLHAVLGGIRNHWRNGLATAVQYGFYQNDEPISHGWNDYTAHLVFGTLTWRWP